MLKESKKENRVRENNKIENVYEVEELKATVVVMKDEEIVSLAQILPLGKVSKGRKGFESSEGAKTPQIFKQVKVKRGIDGLGLFALENIKKGEKIIEYVGNLLLGELEADSKINMYLFEVNKNKTIDGSPRWNTARYINHSCKGNAESEISKGRVYVLATKNIKEGEEITYDYGEEFFKEYIKPKGCRCGALKHKYSK